MHKVEKKSDSLPLYTRAPMAEPIPKYKIPEESMAPDIAYELIHDELMLEGNARLNLATFVTTRMDSQAEKLMNETFNKNMIDKDEYPVTADIEKRCINIISHLFHAQPDENPMGVSTLGSSEAVMLAGLAFKKRWQRGLKKSGKTAAVPNMVMGSNVQVVWEKFCRYWDVEPRYVSMSPDRYVIDPDDIIANIDENTIAVVATLGTTYTGQFEPIKALHDKLEVYNKEHGTEVTIHVDAASGGFVAPFIHPDLEWDFRLPLVTSINVSGHKYGLVYPGVGWVLWRSKNFLPDELVFRVNYLGGDMPTFTLNFSRPGNQVLGQYYNFLRLGHDGYKRIMTQLRDTASYLADSIEKMGYFQLLSHGDDIPVFAFKLKDPNSPFTVFDLSTKMREWGWQVPAYAMPPDIENINILRIVIREGFSRDMADQLLVHIQEALNYFLKPSYVSTDQKVAFSH
ncbi:MAG: glutamate decarboxylase [bacterium]|nr:glutamate decarboxylase [bacterium]